MGQGFGDSVESLESNSATGHGQLGFPTVKSSLPSFKLLLAARIAGNAGYSKCLNDHGNYQLVICEVGVTMNWFNDWILLDLINWFSSEPTRCERDLCSRAREWSDLLFQHSCFTTAKSFSLWWLWQKYFWIACLPSRKSKRANKGCLSWWTLLRKGGDPLTQHQILQQKAMRDRAKAQQDLKSMPFASFGIDFFFFF